MGGYDTIAESWRPVLEPVLQTPQARHLGGFLKAEEAAGKTIYPPAGQRLHALELTPLDKVRVVILGQDPYHGPGQAHGLAFSVPKGIRTPPSLVNIFKEQHADLGLPIPPHGNLEPWARQGVLLLNSALTVEAGRAGSHQNIGWEAITDALVAAVAARPQPCVFLLWGAYAQKKAARIPALGEERHLVLKSVHPSPLSAYNGFFGCRHFSRANEFLAAHDAPVIDWRLD